MGRACVDRPWAYSFYLTVMPFSRLKVFVVLELSFGSPSYSFAFVPRVGFPLNQVSRKRAFWNNFNTSSNYYFQEGTRSWQWVYVTTESPELYFVWAGVTLMLRFIGWLSPHEVFAIIWARFLKELCLTGSLFHLVVSLFRVFAERASSFHLVVLKPLPSVYKTRHYWTWLHARLVKKKRKHNVGL